jgi:hypothetical protein
MNPLKAQHIQLGFFLATPCIPSNLMAIKFVKPATVLLKKSYFYTPFVRIISK